MWIKICANTSVEDALLAAKLGADAVGFVFAPSTRRVTAAHAAAISSELPEHVERIGVFTTSTFNEIIRTSEVGRLSGLQLHGDFDPDLLARLRDHFADRVDLTQTLHWDAALSTQAQEESIERDLVEILRLGAVRRVLLDSRVGALTGGTGRRFDWSAAASTLQQHREHFDLILAGGLRPDNVAEGIDALQPWGVDVASGVEAMPGKKDPAKLEAFIAKASRVSGRSSGGGL